MMSQLIVLRECLYFLHALFTYNLLLSPHKKMLSLYNFCHFNYNVLGVVPFGLILFVTLRFWNLDACFPSQIRKAFCYYVFK